MRRFFLILTLMAMAVPAVAQNGNWTFFVGWSQAVGDFGKVDLAKNDWAFISPNSTKGGAGMGFDLGVQYRKAIGESKMSLVFSADLLYSFPSFAVINNNRRLVQDMAGNFAQVSVTNPKFVNLPLLSGVHFETGLSEGYKVYFEVQGGVAFRRCTDRSASFVDGHNPLPIVGMELYDYIYTDHFYDSPAFAFHLSAGLVDSTHWVLDLGLWHLGSMRLEGTEDLKYDQYPNSGALHHTKVSFKLGTVTPILFTCRLGYRL